MSADPTRARVRRHLLLALLCAAAIVIPRAILIQEAHGEASDDDYHLVRGLDFLRLDRGLVHRELNDPPLGQALAALPLRLMGGTSHGLYEGTAIHGQTGYTAETALAAVAAWKAVLFLPLIAVAFAWCARVYGLRSAWLAAGLLIVEPTITGHLHLAALDVLATTWIVAACYLGWRYFERPTLPRLLAAALACAAALVTKHTAVLVPVILCAYAVLAWTTRRAPDAQEPPLAAHGGLAGLVKAALVTALLMWALLAFDLSPVRKIKTGVPGGLYVESVLDAAGHVRYPNDAYLFGQTRRGGWWYYFPAVATYKVPIGIAVILLVGLTSFVYRRPRRDEWPLLLPAAGYAVFLMSQSINIGWRHFLPAYVFLMLTATRVLANRLPAPVEHAPAAAPPQSSLGRSVAPSLILLAFTATALDTARWFPNYIPYLNWPRANAHLAISDSNVDWGQGLKQADRWLAANGAFVAGRPVYLRAFAVSNRAIYRYLGGRVVRKDAGYPPPRSGVLIVSPVAVAGVSESADEYGFLRGVAPVAVVGRTLRVYDLDRLPEHVTGAPRSYNLPGT
jgi:hypothetical protein